MSAELPRCKHCFYVLEGLESPRCPECGHGFDLSDPLSYTMKPPFLFWRFWLPGLLQAVFLGTVILSGLMLAGSTGWGLTIAAPVVFGAIVGYGCRVHPFLVLFLSICTTIGVVSSLYAMDISGLLCAFVALVVLGLPALFGALLGLALRIRLKNSKFEQRQYFPVIILLVIPPAVALVEAVLLDDAPAETVQTSRVLPVAIDEAWGRIAFYEDLPQEKPWLLRWAGPVPVRSTTETDANGVTRTCIYERGYLRKQITDVQEPTAMCFRVIEQHVGEERSVQLLDGSFQFAEVGPDATRVTLETRYRPKLRPRFCWRPFERLVNSQVHEHVLAGMATNSSNPSDLAIAIAGMTE